MTKRDIGTRLLPLKHPGDFDAIGSPSDRQFILRCLARLRHDPLYGDPLDNRSLEHGRMSFNLGGLRKLKLGKNRVVYRVLPDEMEPWYIEVIAIGHRGHVYQMANERMEAERAA